MTENHAKNRLAQVQTAPTTESAWMANAFALAITQDTIAAS